MIGGFFGAIAFLTRVPVPARPRGGADDLARTVAWFPLVGFLVGLMTAAVYAAAHEVVPPLVAATLAVGAQIAVTGALHEDGLADAADAAGGASPEHRRRIMRDPGHGTFGVIVLVVSTLARVTALGSLGAWSAVAALAAAGALGRAAAVVLLGHPAIDGAGLAASHQAGLTRSAIRAGAAGGVVLAVLAIGPWAAGAVVLAAVVTTTAGRWCRRALGGVSGDVLGAAVVLTECAVLALASAVAGGDGPPLDWWRP